MYDKNIVFLTKREHDLYDAGTIEQRKKYAEEMALQRITVDWNKLYTLRDNLIIEYNDIKTNNNSK